MEWTEQGIVLGTRRYGEANAILELMTRDHGRHLGLVRGGSASRLRPLLQPGNRVSATWRARLDEHLGLYVVEALDVRAASFLDLSHALYGMTHVAALCRLLPERDPHPEVCDALDEIVGRMTDARWTGPAMVRFELQMLTELGFGLDLESCASTGATQDLIYISPRSGRAVSRSAGEPWRDRLFRLPTFLVNQELVPTAEELADGFAATGFFLNRHVLEPRQLTLSDARAHFIQSLTRAMAL